MISFLSYHVIGSAMVQALHDKKVLLLNGKQRFSFRKRNKKPENLNKITVKWVNVKFHKVNNRGLFYHSTTSKGIAFDLCQNNEFLSHIHIFIYSARYTVAFYT